MSKKSPWLAIWTSPRDTIRRVVAENPNKGLWVLALIYGFSSLLGMFQSMSLGFQMGVLALSLIALILAPLWGYIVFSLWGLVIYWTGKIFKGDGAYRAVRASFAWSNVPMIVSDIVWVITMGAFGSAIFTEQNGGNNMSQDASHLFLAFALVRVVMSVWALVICVSGLAEVQRFSILKAIGNLILAAILIAIVAGVLSYFVVMFAGHTGQQTASVFFNY